MNIEEMHKLFRSLGQQMGMQQIRAVLPSTIDMFLNTIINYKVRSLLFRNTNVDFESRIIVRREEIVPINAFRTLYTEYKESVASGTIISMPADTMVLLGVAIQYAANGTRYGCRLIDNVELENTLNDYCNGPYKEHPIANLYTNKVRLYFGDYTPSNYDAFVKYIKYPNKVYLDENNPTNNVDCDLPEYLHTEIVDDAVKKFFESIGYTTPKANEQNQN